MKKFTIILFVLTLVILSGCSNDLTGNGDGLISDGKIMGTIENFKPEAGQILDVHLMLLEELDFSGNFELDDVIIAETTASSSDGYETYEYSFDNIPAGEYYVIAYKDLNGNGSIDLGESGPIDVFGFYGLPELVEMPDDLEGIEESSATVVVQGDKTVTEIDFPVLSTALTTIEEFNGVVYNSEGKLLEEEVEVELYGTAGIKVAEGIHNSITGEYRFEDLLVPGEYYIKTSSAGLMASITPLFYLLTNSVVPDIDPGENVFLWSAFDLDELPEDPTSLVTPLMVTDNTGNDECLPDIVMYTEGEATPWGYESGNVFLVGQVTTAHGGILETNDGIADARATLNSNYTNDGYFYDESWLPDFTKKATSDNGWFVIQDVASGEYTVSAEHITSNFFEYNVIVESDTCITVEIAEIPEA